MTYEHHEHDTSTNTRQAYESSWKVYLEWCATEGREPWDDPTGDTFAAFVVAQVRAGRKPTTLRLHRAAIGYRYRTDPALYGLDDPARTERATAEMKRINRRAPRTDKALPMTPDVMERVLAASKVRRSGEGHDAARLRHLEAEATLRLMYDGALRADDMARVEWGDIDPKPDADGYRTLYVRPGKTREDRYAPVTPPTWNALQRWRRWSPTPDGRITTATGAAPLGQRIYRLGQYCGVPITGHSPRRGRASAAARDGATEYELMALGGWKSPKIANEYVRPLQANRVAARLDKANGNGHHVEPSPADIEHERAKDLWDEKQAGMLLMAAMLDALPADKRAEAIDAQRSAVLALWPQPEPPRPCARPGCPGLVLVLNPRPDERWCNPVCRAVVKRAERAAARAEQTD